MNESQIDLVSLPAIEANIHDHESRSFDASNFEPAQNTDSTSRLPRTDGGKDAWLFLAACFALEALIWGFPFTYGIFQDYYAKEPSFQGQTSIALIGTCSMGVLYLGAPFLFAGLTRWPQARRACTYVGIIIMCSALVLSSFATEVWHLTVTQGVLYSIGGGIAYSPMILFVHEWFVRKKGLAFGIMWAGTSVAGVLLPIIMTSLLSRYGFRTALRIWAIVVAVIALPLLSFAKPRLPLSTTHHRAHSSSFRQLFDLSFLTMPYFLILQACNIIESSGYFLPSLYLPTYARDALHSSNLASAFTVTAINGATVVGTIVMGTLIDKFHVTTCIFVSTMGSTICVFLLWGLATDLPLLYVFAITYGLFAGSFCATWSGVIRDVQIRTDGKADAGLVFAFLAFGRGVGNVLSGPLSVVLIGGSGGHVWKGQAAGGFGSGYGPLIAFTGVSALLGGLSFVVKRIGWL
ncbi:MFS general substrate transporter [Microthyrium microscopicum]|uniref:MFS general substrate transporter n=1 Tax=Microthyrium microscopicum TaxID=703497 RepID=A0A6A6UD92_9PEZI|nr:MFS general substrate transporter [Microthyrium microscopicum]